jgi:hypothetical protein
MASSILSNFSTGPSSSFEKSNTGLHVVVGSALSGVVASEAELSYLKDGEISGLGLRIFAKEFEKEEVPNRRIPNRITSDWFLIIPEYNLLIFGRRVMLFELQFYVSYSTSTCGDKGRRCGRKPCISGPSSFMVVCESHE